MPGVPIRLPESGQPTPLDQGFKQQTNKRFDKLTNVMIAVGAVIVLMVITLMITVFIAVIDSFHFNSATYRDYAAKLEMQNDFLKQNKNLLEQNSKNQEADVQIQKMLQTVLDKLK